MKIGLVGSSYQERSLPFDAQRTVNLYPVMDPQGKEVAALYGTPGLKSFATCGVGPVRGEFAANNGRAFVVSHDGLYEITSTGGVTLRGSLSSISGIVSMDENGVQLAICDGVSVYIFTYSTNVFVKVTDADLPSAGTITFIDGYFVINKNGSGEFYISSLYDGTAWAPLDFATAESSPDDLLRVINAIGQLWLFGSKTTEIWTDNGNAAFPFAKISGAKMETGILAPHSAVAVDNSIFWIGRDSYGKGIVYRAQGFSPQRISTSPVERVIQAAPTPDTLRAYTYQEDGHPFYVITGGGLSTTWTYDILTQQWHERAYLNPLGVFEQHLGACGMFAFDKQLIGSRVNGNIYIMSQDYYSDDGQALKAQRTFTHLSDEGKRMKTKQLQVDFEMGTPVPQQFGPIRAIPNALQGEITSLGTNPIATINGSAIVTVTDEFAFLLQPGFYVTFFGLTAFNGLTIDVLNAHYFIETIIDDHHYTLRMAAPATATGSGGGSAGLAGEAILVFNVDAHGLSNGDNVVIGNSTNLNGIFASDINGEHEVYDVINDDKFAVIASNNATSSSEYFGDGGDNLTMQTVLDFVDPLAMLEISKNGGKTYSNEYTASIGKTGEFIHRAVWRRLGTATQWTIRISLTAAVKRSICGAYLQ